MDMMEIRRRVIVNTPHLEIASGKFANFKTDAPLNLKRLTVSFGYRSSGWDSLLVKHCGVNLLQCDKFTDGQLNGAYFSGVRNSGGEIASISIAGTTSQSNTFRNLNYISGRFRIFEGQTAVYGYSPSANVMTVGNAGSYKNIRNRYPINEPVGTATYWQDYDIDDQTYNSAHTSKHTATWYRIQVYPYVAGAQIDTVLYPMVCHTNDKGCAFEPYHGEDIPVTFPTTVYGGNINLVTGELVSEYAQDGSKLSEPIRYQLTPLSIRAYVGVNNFYCTELNTEFTATYWTH